MNTHNLRSPEEYYNTLGLSIETIPYEEVSLIAKILSCEISIYLLRNTMKDKIYIDSQEEIRGKLIELHNKVSKTPYEGTEHYLH